ncbi:MULTISPECIES: SAVED domain-containing protein [unclassified Nitrospina]|uniref:SAVED domain-containing protein n=1 Tax=unclassified Nitrospina TaxID=2638683 RepID=UPI003F96E2C4
MGRREKTITQFNLGGSSSPVKQVDHRNIDEKTRRHLFVISGGRCEFLGCNDYLMEHHLTLTPGNFAQAAHIVAFKCLGPRGDDLGRPEDINDITNLMLLCPKCHKLVDDHPEEFLRNILEDMKRSHEDRIILATSQGPNMRSALVIFKAPIGGQNINIPDNDIREALAPRFPASLPGTIIDLSHLAGGSEANILDIAQELIQKKLATLFQTNGDAEKVGHVSVFGIGPIAMLIVLGNNLSNKIPTDFFQRHRDTENWTWKTGGTPAEYQLLRRIEGPADGPVGLLLSLSGTIDISTIPDEFVKEGSVYEIVLSNQTPTPTFLKQNNDLEAFRLVYQETLGAIMREHGAVDKIALFPAVPAPVAVLCGRERLPKVHPALCVYDYDRAAGGFNFQIEVS